MNNRFKYRLNKKWWFNSTRGYTWFSFRYWWMNYLLWVALIGLFSWMLWKMTDLLNDCPEQQQVNELMRKIERDLENCCECLPEPVIDSIPKAPEENCRVHFSGLFMGDHLAPEFISKIYQVDNYSEYVGSGFYPDNSKAFPNAVRTSFDGIAIDKGTRLIIYSEKNFNGSVLLDIHGPAIVNNVLHKDNQAVNFCNTINFIPELQSNYPQSVRKWSNSNMRDWSYGSCKIMCDD